MKTRIYRSTSEQMVGGVAAGLARAWNLDPTLVRAGFVIGALFTHGALALVYLVLWAVLPGPASTAADLGGVVRENVNETAARVGMAAPLPPNAAPPAAPTDAPAQSAAPPAWQSGNHPGLLRLLVLAGLIYLAFSALSGMAWGWHSEMGGLHHGGGPFFLWPLLLVVGGFWLFRRLARR